MTLSQRAELAKALFGKSESSASVTRITGTALSDSADGTVTVQLEDGDEVELGSIGGVREGDTVTIHVQRGDAQVIAAEGWGDRVQAAADEAQAVAEATGQHFWHDTNGAHVTEVTADEWAQANTGHNALWNSLGMLFRKALVNLVSITESAIAFFDGEGNDGSNVVASFGRNGVTLGREGESRLVLDAHRMRLTNSDGDDYFYVSDTVDAGTEVTWTQWIEGDGTAGPFYLDYEAVDTSYSVYEYLDASVPNPPVLPTSSKTTTEFTLQTAVEDGEWFVVVFTTTEYTSNRVLSFGDSIPEGDTSVSLGGAGNEVTGKYSMAVGSQLHATADMQTVVGFYNDARPTARFIVGCGVQHEAPRNGFEVRQNGNVVIGGKPYLFGYDDPPSGTPLEDVFVLEQVSAAIGAVSANSDKTLTIAATKTNHKPIAVSGFYLSGAAKLNVYMCRLSGTNVQIYLHNGSSSAQATGATAYVQVLYIRTA